MVPAFSQRIAREARQQVDATVWKGKDQEGRGLQAGARAGHMEMTGFVEDFSVTDPSPVLMVERNQGVERNF